MSKGSVRRIRLRAVVTYPAVALVAALALLMTPFGPAQGAALAALATPTQTAAAAPAPAVPTTVAPTSVPTTVAPTSVPTTDAPTSVPTIATPTTAAPALTTPSSPTPLTSTPAATTVPGPVPNPTPGPDPSLAAALVDAPVDHHVFARIGDSDFQATYLAVDAPAPDASQFQTFRVRFQMHNDGTEPVVTTPQLEYRADGAADFALVPEAPQLGSPFHVAREWVPGVGGGTAQGPLEEDLAAVDFKMPIQAGEAVIGHHSMGANPDAPVTLPAASYTEQEFTVRLSMDAQYLSGYELRITDGGTAPLGAQVARIVLGPQPALELSAGQRQGVTVLDPTAANAAGAGYPLLNAPTTAANTTSVAAVPANDGPSPVLYALDSGSLSPATVAVSSLVSVAETDIPVVESSNTHGQCAACHRGHVAKASDLTKESQQSTLCFTCHGGAGATGAKDVESQYTDLLVPANNPGAREYYSHDALASTTPTPSEPAVIGTATNRQSACADCHNSHRAKDTDSAQTATGWDASGRLAGVSGVSVLNGEAGTPPTYTPLDGVTDLVTREYQLCFKCHSGSTTLTSNDGLKPSQYALDKGVEFNPNNPSFHPVEAAGTNQTTKMTDSLAGTSPYKLWNFNIGSTIRCLNCHAGGKTPDVTPTPPPTAAGGDLAPHTSSNRGILLENYLDRELKPRADSATLTAAYSAGDFALCYVCHAEAPFANKSDPPDGSSNATNFKLHGLHLTGLAGKGDGGTDIDTAGDGQGNATCAECHFRIHSTTNKVGTQAIPGSRLVNFSPNVRPAVTSGTLSWTAGATGGGSCTLTCHGYEHTSRPYSE